MRVAIEGVVLLNNCFLNPKAVLTPVIILLFGLLVRLLLSAEDVLEKLRQSPLFSESNVFNKIFANYGFIVFTVLYLLITTVQLKLRLNQSVLPLYQHRDSLENTRQIESDTGISVKRKILYHVLDVITKYTIIFIGLALLLYMRSVIRAHTDVNVSGHFMTITAITTSLLMEIQALSEVPEINDGGIKVWCITTVNIGIIMWWCVLFVTAVFYHTTEEKLYGLLQGYITPLLVYYIKPLVHRI